jgi:hypothetical protein
MCGRDDAHSQPSSSGAAVSARPISPVRRAPRRSVSRPSTRRSTEPPSSGTDTMKPTDGAMARRCSSFDTPSGCGQSCAEMLTLRAPSSTQIMKLTSK